MSPRLSVVAPVYDEAAILLELGRRCLTAARSVDPDAEVLLVDDGSRDDTRRVAEGLPEGVRLHALPENRGQLRATLAGLAEARGEVVVVLDGDLQDPPEAIPGLVAALDDAPDADVVFGVKARRDDPAWFRVGRAAYGLLARLPGARVVPSGAGAFCAMRRATAAATARLSLREGNLAAVLVARGVAFRTLPYDKAARYDDSSRVGAVGLAREALASLALTGALTVLARALAALLLVAFVLTRSTVVLALAAGTWLAGEVAGRRAARHLIPPEASP